MDGHHGAAAVGRPLPMPGTADSFAHGVRDRLDFEEKRLTELEGQSSEVRARIRALREDLLRYASGRYRPRKS